MNALLDFACGVLFAFSFSLMILGLFRLVALALLGTGEAFLRAGDRTIDYAAILRDTLSWLFPIRRWAAGRPAYSLISIAFHVGLIPVPFFLAAHIHLWKQATGVSWPAMPQILADVLTVVTILGGIALFWGRILNRSARAISRLQDFLWPLLLTVPAFSGFLCANFDLSAGAYRYWMLVHVLSANVIMICIPFTKLAHCVLMPLTQLVGSIGWKFRAEAGNRIGRMQDGKRG